MNVKWKKELEHLLLFFIALRTIATTAEPYEAVGSVENLSWLGASLDATAKHDPDTHARSSSADRPKIKTIWATPVRRIVPDSKAPITLAQTLRLRMDVKSIIREVTPPFLYKAAHRWRRGYASTASTPVPAVASRPEPSPSDSAPAAPKFDGAHSRQWWATRDNAASSAPGYWEKRHHPLRTEIGRTLSTLSASSLLEVGCHAGMNLWSATQFQRWDRLAGIELSAVVLDYAREVLPVELGCGVELMQASADNIPFSSNSFDAVLTAGTLVCIGPEEIEAALSEICRVSRRWIVLVEPIEIDARFATAAGREDPYPNTMYWIRNYAGLLEGQATLTSLVPLPRHQQMGHLNSIAVFELLDWESRRTDMKDDNISS